MEPPQIIVNIYQPAKKPVNTTGIVFTIIGLFINGILAYFTYKLFEQTVTQTTNSKEAVTQAKRANDLTREAFDSSQIENQRTYDLNKTAFDIQVQSLKEAAKQFEIGNQPHLQFQDFTIKAWSKGKPIAFTYVIKNMGNHPVKLYQMRTGFKISSNASDKDSARKTFPITPTTQYITKDNPAPKTFKTTTYIPDAIFDMLISGGLSFFYLGEVFYVNTVTNKKYKYLFTVKLDVITQTTTLLENDNVPIN